MQFTFVKSPELLLENPLLFIFMHTVTATISPFRTNSIGIDGRPETNK